MSTTSARTNFDALLSTLADEFEREGRPGGTLAANTLRDCRNRVFRRAAQGADPGSILHAACTLADALPMVSHVLGCRSLLDWTNWTGEGLDDGVSAKLFSTELIGPDGHIPADDVRVGLLVSDTHIDYPVSSHSGEETYLVLAGLAEWTVAGSPYTARSPGTLIHHPAWVPHGRRTSDQPFLGAWRWSGDLDLSTFRVGTEK
ncbi:MAG: dimethylsulfonioproprionate lyase family protein [Hyphomicrobiaceae bacterium]